MYFLVITVMSFAKNSNLLVVMSSATTATVMVFKTIKLAIVIIRIARNKPVRPFKDSKDLWTIKKEPKCEY